MLPSGWNAIWSIPKAGKSEISGRVKRGAGPNPVAESYENASMKSLLPS